jgi:hypothetical protein
MNKLFAALIALAMGISTAFAAADRGTPEEAEALVKKAIVHYKKVGKDKALADLMRKDSGYIDRDLYVTVYTPEGVALAHINPKFVGKNMLDLRDESGKIPHQGTHRARAEAGQGLAGPGRPLQPADQESRGQAHVFRALRQPGLSPPGAYKPN